jgi:acetyl-CoA C-acetyltransferase
MSNAPYILKNARGGYRYGDGTIFDLMIHDGLWDPYFNEAMAASGARVAAELGVTRDVQDEFAYQSHQRAHTAHESGAYADELVPLRVASKAADKIVVDRLPAPARPRVLAHAGRNGGGSVWDHTTPESMAVDMTKYSPYLTGDVPATLVDRDEPVRANASIETMAKLRAIDAGGTITAGNAPGVNDGACALVLADPEYARANGVEPLATIVGHATVAYDPPYLALVPAMASQKLLDRVGMSASQIDVWEINEAFAAVALTAATRLGLDPTKINAQGGAVALGHPIGASGCRVIVTLIHALRARQKQYGVASLCIGGGMGIALVLRSPSAG